MIMSFQSDEHHEFGINLDNLSSYTFEDGNVKISMANGDVHKLSGECADVWRSAVHGHHKGVRRFILTSPTLDKCCSCGEPCEDSVMCEACVRTELPV
jgi:hypothetical protein